MANLAVSMDHAAMPLSVPGLLDQGSGYSQVAPAPPVVLLLAMQQKVQTVRQSIGRTH